MKDDVILYYFILINDDGGSQKLEGYTIILPISTSLKEKYQSILGAENRYDFKTWSSDDTVTFTEEIKLKYRKVIALKEFLE